MTTFNGLTPEEAAALLQDSPAPRARFKAPDSEPFYDSVSPLTEEDLHPTGTSAPIVFGTPALLKIRQSHHRLAQLIALGMSNLDASRVTGYDAARVSVLRSDPAFLELVAHYSKTTETAWGEFVQIAADLSVDAMTLLRDKMEENPAQFSPSMLLEMTKVLADRTGNAPMTKSVNVSMNVDLSERMARAKERVRSLNEG